MNQFESGSLVAIADVPEDLIGKVVQGQPVRIVQTCFRNDAEVLVEGLNRKEYPIAVVNLCSLEDSCKARAARWFLCDILTHRESLAAYEQVVENELLDNLLVWSMFEYLDALSLSLLMQNMVTSLMSIFPNPS